MATEVYEIARTAIIQLPNLVFDYCTGTGPYLVLQRFVDDGAFGGVCVMSSCPTLARALLDVAQRRARDFAQCAWLAMSYGGDYYPAEFEVWHVTADGEV